jgi:hypothetical protein
MTKASHQSLKKPLKAFLHRHLVDVSLSKYVTVPPHLPEDVEQAERGLTRKTGKRKKAKLLIFSGKVLC